MSHIESKQKMFFEELKNIQERAVIAALCNYKSNDETENMLYEITYDVVCDIMALIDGYKNEDLKLDLILKEENVSLKTGIELHDTCADYLKYRKKGDV